ncbi:MAG: hypothetical protein IPL32_10785 [Chloracidobacterium sp.]|nr:hypothetical protein [Chloracidobacterium sp.]
MKGKAVKGVTLLDTYTEYVTRNEGFETLEEVDAAQVVPEITIDDGEDVELASRTLKAGDTVLLFLRNDDETKRLELTDWHDAMKKLSPSDLAVYEARIKELAPILAAEEPDPEKIVDWLVRCAEDPATRWEGTSELENSFRELENKLKREAEQKAKFEKGEDLKTEFRFYYSQAKAEYAEAANEYHKQTLANLLLNNEFQSAPKRPGQDGFVRGDSELIQLVSRWADDRIALVFMNRLRGGTYSPGEIADLMDSIASILKDDELKEMLDSYRDHMYQKGDDEVDESDIEDVEEADDVEEAVDTEKPAAGLTAGSADTKAEPADQTDTEEIAKRRPMTFNEYRTKMINKFLLRADEVLTNPEALISESNKKEER